MLDNRSPVYLKGLRVRVYMCGDPLPIISTCDILKLPNTHVMYLLRVHSWYVIDTLRCCFEMLLHQARINIDCKTIPYSEDYAGMYSLIS